MVCVTDEAQKYNSIAIAKAERAAVVAEREFQAEEGGVFARVCPEAVAKLGAARLTANKTLRSKHADESWLCKRHRLAAAAKGAAASGSRPQSFLFCQHCFKRKTRIEEEREGAEAYFAGPEVYADSIGCHIVQGPLESKAAWWDAAENQLAAPPGGQFSMEESLISD